MRLVLKVVALTAFGLNAAVEPWFGTPIPASGEDNREDCGMTAARVFDAPIAGLERIGTLAIPQSADLPDASNASIGFECLDRGLFDPDRCYDTLAAAGVKWARCQTMWSRCEKKKGVYDFSVLDGVVDNLTRRGIRPWFSVTFGNTLYMTNCYTGAAVGCVPTLYGEECKAAWRAYVRELARRYKGKVTHWEIWNEPNLPQFWQPSKPSAADYLALVKLTGGVIREEIPDAQIGGTTASPALNKWEQEFFELGGAHAIDFWCGHAYTRVPERLRRQQRIASGASDDYVTVLQDVRAFIDAHGGKHVAIWQGESGFPSWFPAGHWLWWPKTVCKEGWQSQANQAKWLLRRFVTDRRAGIERSSFFQMADISRHYSMATTTQSHPAEHGIVNGWTYKPKMSCHAFGHYNALLATARHDASIEVSLSPAADGGAPIVATAFRATDGNPLFLYYTAFDFSGAYTGTCYTARRDAKLTVPAALAPKDPVLVDLLRGGVYSVSSRTDFEGKVTFSCLPLTDYPLVLAGRSSVKTETLAAPLTLVAKPMIDDAHDRVQTTLDPMMDRIGTLVPRSAREIGPSRLALGCEMLPREYGDFENFKEYMPPLGIARVRLHAGWAKLEPEKGKWDFEWLDRQVNWLIENGMEPLLETSYGNPIYPGAGGASLSDGMPRGEEALAAWDRYVEKLATRYPQVKNWACWNEPNNIDANTPEIVVDNNIRTARIIKKHIPGAKIGMLTLGTRNMNAFTEACLKLFKKKDAIGLFTWIIYHDYSPNPDTCYPIRVDEWVKIVRKYAPELKIWNGESGATSDPHFSAGISSMKWNSELTQAKWNARRLVADLGHGFDSLVFTMYDPCYDYPERYCRHIPPYWVRTRPDRFMKRMGLVKCNDRLEVTKVKPAYYTVQNIATLFDATIVPKKVYTRLAPGASADGLVFYTFRQEGTGIPLVALWDASKHPVNENEVRRTSLEILKAEFKEPVWIDLVTGAIYRIPERMVINLRNGKMFEDVPFYDAPAVITERALAMGEAK